jgi:hypothetical protein
MKEFDHLKNSHSLIDQQLEYYINYYCAKVNNKINKFFFLELLK